MVPRVLLSLLVLAAVGGCGSPASDDDLLSGRACADGSGLGRALQGPVDPAVDLAPALDVSRQLVALRGNVSRDDSAAERRSRLEALTAGPSRRTRTETVEESLSSFDVEPLPEGWRVTGSAYASTGPC